MLAIRMQRTGRKGYASFRIVVQDSRFTPQSGRVVEQLGYYNPHTKEVSIDKSATEKYLSNGAQPTQRVVAILEAQKIKTPNWVIKARKDKKVAIKNSEKLRRNRPNAAEPVHEDNPEESSQVEEQQSE